MTSNSTLSSGWVVRDRMARVETPTRPTASSTTASACRCASGQMRRRKAVTSERPRISAQTTMPSSRKVVTLMPPAVPALPPPISIRPLVRNRVSGRICPMSTALKPAVRLTTEWVKAFRALPPADMSPIVPALFHSATATPAKPRNRRPRVPSRVSLAWIDHRRGVRHSRSTSLITGKPSPLTMTAAHRGNRISGSRAKPMRLSE